MSSPLMLFSTDQILYPLIKQGSEKKDSISIRSTVFIGKTTGNIVFSNYEVILNWVSSDDTEVIFEGKTYSECYTFIPKYVAEHYPNIKLAFHFTIFDKTKTPIAASHWDGEDFKEYDGFESAIEAAFTHPKYPEEMDTIMNVFYTLPKD